MSTTAKHVSIRCSGPAALTIGPRLNDAGQPTQRFEKEVLRVGTWTHPDTGQAIEIDDGWIDNAVNQFAAMSKAGVKVGLPSGHSFEAKDNRGWVVSLFRRDDRLMAWLDAIGEDAIKEVSRNDVSIYAAKEWTDASGNKYDWAIQHVALTPTPVIPGQTGAVAIAASNSKLGIAQLPVFALASDMMDDEDEEEKKKKKGHKMEKMKKLAGAMGLSIAEGTTEDAMLDALIAEASKIKTAATTATASLATEKKRADDAVLALDATKKGPQFDPVTLNLHGEVRAGKLEKIYLAGKMTKDEYEKHLAMWIGGADRLALSATLDTANDQRFRQLLDILDKRPQIRDLNDAQTAAQGVVLSHDRQNNGSEADPDMALRLARAGIPAKK